MASTERSNTSSRRSTIPSGKSAISSRRSSISSRRSTISNRRYSLSSGQDDFLLVMNQFVPASVESLSESEKSEVVSREVTTEIWKLSPLISAVCVMILDNSCDELEILNCSYRKYGCAAQEFPTNYIPPDIRFGFSEEACQEETLKNTLSNKISNFSILIQVVTLVREILGFGITELLESNTFSKLFKTLRDNLMMRYDENVILSSYNKLYRLSNILSGQIISEKMELLNDIRKVDAEIIHAKEMLQAEISNAGVKYITVLSWEESRREQNLRKRKMQEEKSIELIKNKKNSADDEKIAHNEMVNFFVEHTADLQEEILQWMNTYDEKIDDLEVQVTKKSLLLNELQIKVEDLEKEIKKRVVQMKEWKGFKLYKNQYNISKALKDRAARIIQKWWRNILPILKKKRRAAKKKKNKKNKLKQNLRTQRKS